MKVRYVSSACVVVEHAGRRVLCDPWLTEGIDYGSRHHHPPLKFTPEDFADVDAIYVSHVHPDHLDVETLKRLPRSIPVVVLDYAEKFVHRILSGLGFRVVEVAHGGSYEVAPGFTLELYAADDGDPEACGKFLGCAVPAPYEKTLQIDSVAVFRGGDGVVVDVNDASYALTRGALDRVLDRHPRVDLLLAGYSGAGPSPQDRAVFHLLSYLHA